MKKKLYKVYFNIADILTTGKIIPYEKEGASTPHSMDWIGLWTDGNIIEGDVVWVGDRYEVVRVENGMLYAGSEIVDETFHATMNVLLQNSLYIYTQREGASLN